MPTQNPHRTVLLALALALSAALAPAPAAAQSRKLLMDRLGYDKLPDLKVYMNFVEGDGTPITGANPGDFKLVLDAADQGPAKALTTFGESKEPIYVIAVVQLSPAMEPVLDEAKKGIREIADTLSNIPGSKMGLLGYAGDVKRLVESGSATDIGAKVGEMAVDPEGAEVHMLDGVTTAIDLLRAQEKGRRKLIVLFSDGINVVNEKKAFTDMGRKAEREGVIIDTIGYAPFDASKLKSLAELTKQCYGIERVAKSPQEISPRFGAVVEEILKQYVATFALSIQGDDKEHTFQILNEVGQHPVYTNVVSRPLLSKAPAAPEPDTAEPVTSWNKKWLLLLLIPLVGLILYLLLRKKKEEPVAAAPPGDGLQAPMPSAGRANRTMAIEASGDVAMGWVMGLTGPLKDTTYKLKNRTVIGTAQDCDIVVPDPTMSAHHCEIRKSGDGAFTMVDLGSTNGVVVNDKKVREHFLVDNDAFRLGRTEFKFKSIIS